MMASYIFRNFHIKLWWFCETWLLFLVSHEGMLRIITCMCTIITTVQAILPYKCIVILDTSTYINTSSPIADCFPESTVTLDVELINGRFVTYVSDCFVHWLDSKDNTIFVHVLCVYIMQWHDCIIALYSTASKHRIAPLRLERRDHIWTILAQ